MRLKRLEILDFRNYPRLELEFGGKREIFLGDNAQGKSNLLEAIAILARGRSPFLSREDGLIRWERHQAIIRSLFEKKEGDVSIDLLFQRGGKRSIKINGFYQKRVSDLLGRVSTVLFTCGDIGMVKGPPASRRAFVDEVLLQLPGGYSRFLHPYEKILAQRNQLLRQHVSDPGEMEVWDVQLAKYAASIEERRVSFIREIAPLARKHHSLITEGKEDLELRWEPSFSLEGDQSHWPSSFLGQLRERREKDLNRGSTSIGPHRDDLRLILDQRDSHSFASQGQQRSIVLSLKLAELDLLTDMMGESPLLLLDDVLAELDIKRQNKLLESIGENIQTFVTTTHLSDFTAGWIEGAEIFAIEKGKAIPYRGSFSASGEG
jgi:DNA replication and repair protein RecF